MDKYNLKQSKTKLNRIMQFSKFNEKWKKLIFAVFLTFPSMSNKMMC